MDPNLNFNLFRTPKGKPWDFGKKLHHVQYDFNPSVKNIHNLWDKSLKYIAILMDPHLNFNLFRTPKEKPWAFRSS